jgi:hypothetical protein
MEAFQAGDRRQHLADRQADFVFGVVRGSSRVRLPDRSALGRAGGPGTSRLRAAHFSQEQHVVAFHFYRGAAGDRRGKSEAQSASGHVLDPSRHRRLRRGAEQGHGHARIGGEAGLATAFHDPLIARFCLSMRKYFRGTRHSAHCALFDEIGSR